MKHKIDIDTWIRKEHFEFFSKFEEPIYGVCVNVDVTNAYQFVKQNKISFFLYTLYLSLTAAHQVKPFKYRIEGDEVFIYDTIDGGSTVARPNGTFGYGYYPYYPTLAEFLPVATGEITRVQARTDRGLILPLSRMHGCSRYPAAPPAFRLVK
jgi:chloramphenicol O-acetyltransferase type A